MGSQRAIPLHLFLFFLGAGFTFASSSSSFVANEVLENHGFIGRSILQQKTHCTVLFESMNFTTFITQCKGPTYTVDGCCGPMKDVACPVKDQLNDLSTDCALIFFTNCMFGMPPGMFATLCKDGEHGMKCKDGGEISVEAMRAATSRACDAGRPALEVTLFVGLSLIVMLFSPLG